MSLRFGIFEFDPSKGLLYREGNHVRLQAQPAQVLALLLQKNDEVVTRAEIREAVWGSDIHVDFDRGLNFCVAQIRSALGDSAGSPIYIRTIPKLGYQFIALGTDQAYFQAGIQKMLSDRGEEKPVT